MNGKGVTPAPLEEKRDMYQEAIEELLDAIYYLSRRVISKEALWRWSRAKPRVAAARGR